MFSIKTLFVLLGVYVAIFAIGFGSGFLLLRSRQDPVTISAEAATSSYEKNMENDPIELSTSLTPANPISPGVKQFPLTDDVVPQIPQVRSQTILVPNIAEIRIPILIYHYIRDYHDASDRIGEDLSVSPENFRKQMAAVRDGGYTTVTLTDVASSVYFNKALPEKPIVITFDDGYEDAFTQAFPVLQEYNMTGTFAIITGIVGNPGYLTWPQIRQMHAMGHDMVSHTVHHPNLASADDAKILSELQESKFTLDMMLGKKTVALVYPAGQHNARVDEIAKSLGYLIGRGTGEGTYLNASNVFSLPVVRMMNDSPLKF